MITRIRLSLLAICVLACDRSASSRSTDSAATVATVATAQSAPQVVNPRDTDYDRVAPDSSFGYWTQEGNGFFGGSHVRHPSGMLTLWFDTATRATEDRPVGRAHADSVVVQGLQHGEWLGRYCMLNGSADQRIVGIVRDTTPATRPRLAWLFDSESFRIRTIPTDSVSCFLELPPDEDY